MFSWRKWRLKTLKRKAEAYFKFRQTNQVSDTVIAKEVALYYRMAKLYDKSIHKKKFANAELLALENYRAAAALGNAEAQYIVAKRLIEKGKFWDTMIDSFYYCRAHEQYRKQCDEEAFVYLQSAEDFGHALAIRLHGLAYINGWGEQEDKTKGFQLVVASIEKDNAWHRATQIFDEIGLNKPEFFSYIMKAKEQHR